MSTYIKILRKVYKGQLDELEDIYNDYVVSQEQMTFNELLVQFHFQQLESKGLLTAKSMMSGLPSQFHWIVKKHLKHDIKNVPIVQWCGVDRYLQDSLDWNWVSDDDYAEYQQLHSPLRNLT